MKIIPDQLRSTNLVPFKKRQGKYKIPGMATENPISMDRVDTDLSPEEQGYIRHFLGYADALLRSADDNVQPKPQEDKFQLTEMAIEERPLEKQPREEKRAEDPAEEPVLAKEDPAKEDSSQAA
jgi:hypothetical protein